MKRRLVSCAQFASLFLVLTACESSDIAFRDRGGAGAGAGDSSTGSNESSSAGAAPLASNGGAPADTDGVLAGAEGGPEGGAPGNPFGGSSGMDANGPHAGALGTTLVLQLPAGPGVRTATITLKEDGTGKLEAEQSYFVIDCQGPADECYGLRSYHCELDATEVELLSRIITGPCVPDVTCHGPLSTSEIDLVQDGVAREECCLDLFALSGSAPATFTRQYDSIDEMLGAYAGWIIRRVQRQAPIEWVTLNWRCTGTGEARIDAGFPLSLEAERDADGTWTLSGVLSEVDQDACSEIATRNIEGVVLSAEQANEIESLVGALPANGCMALESCRRPPLEAALRINDVPEDSCSCGTQILPEYKAAFDELTTFLEDLAR